MTSGQELAAWYDQAKQKAIAFDISLAEVDWLLQEVAELDNLSLRLELFKERSQIPLKRSLSELNQLWERRLSERLPVQYLLGSTSWRHFSLTVSPNVLIPRPETEMLIDLAEMAVKEKGDLSLQSGHWADLGTGSGAIALGLAEVFPAAQIHAVDASQTALEIAQENAKRLGFTERIDFHYGSWWQPLEAFKGQIHGMVSNPPYIPTELIPHLQPEVVKHEPHSALDGGKDGLDCIRHLIQTSPDYLRPDGVWLIEMMAGQAEKVAQLLEENGSYRQIQIFPDLAGIERFALAYKC
ncbi:MAG: peptide chain release factor N(5)-glutamine methyltransferase [Chroococcales cyanobacterium]